MIRPWLEIKLASRLLVLQLLDRNRLNYFCIRMHFDFHFISILNSSPIDEHWEMVPRKLVGAWRYRRQSREVSMATQRAGTTPASSHQRAPSHWQRQWKPSYFHFNPKALLSLTVFLEVRCSAVCLVISQSHQSELKFWKLFFSFSFFPSLFFCFLLCFLNQKCSWSKKANHYW